MKDYFAYFYYYPNSSLTEILLLVECLVIFIQFYGFDHIM